MHVYALLFLLYHDAELLDNQNQGHRAFAHFRDLLMFDIESYAHRPLSYDLVKELSTMNKLHDHEDLLP